MPRKTTANAKHRSKEQPATCPECNLEKIAYILRGMPNFTDEMKRQLDAGEVVLGGCLIRDDMPRWKCAACGAQVYDEAL